MNMTDEERQQLLDHFRKVTPTMVATELVSVQPMSNAFFESWDTNAWKTEEELIAQGFEPVCPYSRLMWVKKQ